MSDFTTDTPGTNGPSSLGPRPQASPTTPPTTSPTPASAPLPDSPPRHAAARPDAVRPAATDPVPEVRGRIHIADEVVEKVAALAASEVEGVADLGGDLARAVESVRERIGIGAKRGDQGVKADVKGSEVAIDVTVMVEFGHVVLDVARQVQRNVAIKTQRMLGLKVVEVNVTVDDVGTARRDDETSNGGVTAG